MKSHQHQVALSPSKSVTRITSAPKPWKQALKFLQSPSQQPVAFIKHSKFSVTKEFYYQTFVTATEVNLCFLRKHFFTRSEFSVFTTKNTFKLSKWQRKLSNIKTHWRWCDTTIQRWSSSMKTRKGTKRWEKFKICGKTFCFIDKTGNSKKPKGWTSHFWCDWRHTERNRRNFELNFTAALLGRFVKGREIVGNKF